ncbi:MAG: hypothetical protein Pg6C_20890 [Treponemataceae bacterium]|nr:MAG: hypothetical protein Pg6C_20890 [Treponemataceae bacterium]
MSDGAISQDEIDALLSGSSMSGGAAASPSVDLTHLNDFSKKSRRRVASESRHDDRSRV